MIDISKYPLEEQEQIREQLRKTREAVTFPCPNPETGKNEIPSDFEQVEKLRRYLEQEKHREFGKQKFDEGFAYCEEKHKFILVSERLPFESGKYIVQTSNVGIIVAWFEAGEFIFKYPATEAVAWQYLPEEIEN
jgi:hypothetical protein